MLIHSGSDQNEFNANVVTNNGGIGGGGGFFIISSQGNVIANNDISGNPLNPGVRVFDSHRNIIRGNIANGNFKEGIRIDGESIGGFPASSGNLVEGNTARGNERDLADYNPAPPCINTWTSNTFETDSEGDGPGAGCIH